MALDQMVRYLSSDQGKKVRDLLGEQLVSGLEHLQDESWDIVRQGRLNSALNVNDLGRILTTLTTSPPLSRESPQLSTGLLNRLSEAAVNLIIESDNLPSSTVSSEKGTSMDPVSLATTPGSLPARSTPSSTSTIAALKKVARIVRASNLNVDKTTALLKRVRHNVNCSLHDQRANDVLYTGLTRASLARAIRQSFQ